MLLCLSSPGLYSVMLVACAVRPRTLRRSDGSSVPAVAATAAAEWIEDSTGGKKVFNWDRKKKMGKWTFVS